MSLHITPKMVERFWSHVSKTDGCWPWTAGYRQQGRYKHGMFALASGITVYAHRFSYRVTYGPIGSLRIHHTCGNGLCVRPDHLQAMTHAEHQNHHVQLARKNRSA
jgi:HNH endonuclease